jgi:PhnB protein
LKVEKENMANINSYLTFNGNCLEAMAFYQECLGGDLQVQRVGESTLVDGMSSMKDYVLHATLKNEEIVLMGSDMANPNGVKKGNNISIMLNCNDEDHILECYAKLSAGGERTHPVESTFLGALFGSLTDKYGNHWLLYYQTSPHELVHNNEMDR